ncbi:helix-turn-helix transcriptional regulator [Micromonospora sp. WMMD812]|uniref:helix-turn-helix domain-containing protein n=1 Tax=Micromonospora sp. WMMD812 TaxID=3015152 RepID=UPI00248ABE27|nr:helix-turn-helix transcriptional regulator [Micromonospora sp. WMMD812]WBB69640.1 helix-turn-helix transcriptional regulator [Micromonospora sp. WMMD812]
MEETLLERLGVSAAAEAVYWAMLDHPTWDVDELVTNLDIPETVVHDALAALADRALITPSTSRPGALRAVSPQIGLLALLDQAEQQMIAQQAKLQAARASVLARAASHDTHREREEIVRLEGVDAVRDRLAEHARTASESFMTLTTGRAMPAQAIETGKTLTRIALSRGVTIRHIYQESTLHDAASRAYAELMAEQGEQSRVMQEAPLRMTLVDRQFALIPIEPHSGRGALEIRGNRLVSALCLLFDLLWERSTPFPRPSTADENGLTDQAVAILRLLRQGRTDEAIGRQLGLSERTVRRTVRDLMQRLDAESRFQAGVEAALRRWI